MILFTINWLHWFSPGPHCIIGVNWKTRVYCGSLPRHLPQSIVSTYFTLKIWKNLGFHLPKYLPQHFRGIPLQKPGFFYSLSSTWSKQFVTIRNNNVCYIVTSIMTLLSFKIHFDVILSLLPSYKLPKNVTTQGHYIRNLACSLGI